MSGETEDCLSCRLISGFGIIGMGAYIYYQGKRRKPLERYAMNLMSTGAAALGVARLFNMRFLKARKDGS
ncbi:uncharacterized protein LOC142220565 [Haematobia irritans]|uniref:uncharacterized protein LOC142220565 n=1 Tax=Haematobia irritans TaxID=7368 RepID=UPI003F5030E8